MAPSRTSVVYAVVEAKEHTALYRSDDLGAHWQEGRPTSTSRCGPFYFAPPGGRPHRLAARLQAGAHAVGVARRRQVVHLALQRRLRRRLPRRPATRCGSTRATPSACCSAPTAASTRSSTAAASWRHLRSLPLSQVYRVAYDMARPYNVYVGLQDNGSWMGPSRAPGGVAQPATGRTSASATASGPSPTSRTATPSTRRCRAAASSATAADRRDQADRALPATPARRSCASTGTPPTCAGPSGALYAGAQHLFRSRDKGESWQRISPDLTTNDPKKQKQFESGGLTVDNSTAENHTTIYAIAESPKNASVLWVGTDDGNLQLSRDGGKTLDERRRQRRPACRRAPGCRSVEASPHAEGTAFATFDGHRTGDMRTYAYMTSDFGDSWRRLADRRRRGLRPRAAPGPRARRAALPGHRDRAVGVDRRRRPLGALRRRPAAGAGDGHQGPPARRRPHRRHPRPRRLGGRRPVAAARAHAGGDGGRLHAAARPSPACR